VDPGGDEHFELLKSYMTSKLGYSAGVPWNDQPPLHTLVMATVFKVSGGWLGAVRSLSLVATFGLVLGVTLRLGRSVSPALIALAIWLLISTRSTFLLMCTNMLEVPAFALALLGSHLLLTSGNRIGSALGGVVWGMAVLTKLTCLIAGPGLLLASLIPLIRNPRKSEAARTLFPRLACFFGSGLVVVAVVCLCLNITSLDSLWVSHSIAAQDLEASQHVFRAGTYFGSPIGLSLLLLACVPGAWNAIRLHSPFELGWFLTALAVHLNHTPYWTFYELHLNIPAVILISRSIQSITDTLRSSATWNRPLLRIWNLGVLPAGVILGAIVYAIPALKEVDHMQRQTKISESKLVELITEHTGPQDVLFSYSGMLNVVCDRLSIPIIAIRPAKRLWSGALDSETIWAIVRAERPRAIVWISNAELPAEMMEFLRSEYDVVYKGSHRTLWLTVRSLYDCTHSHQNVLD
jgi:hypothetical protein